MGRGFPGDLRCRAPCQWGLPLASRRFVHLIPESLRRGHAGLIQRFHSMSGGNGRIFSFEFFPPATPQGAAKLKATREQLAQLGPKFFSVTFGAGGSTRDRTLSAVLEIQSSGQCAAPHISCIGSTRVSIRDTLATYRQHRIGHLVALRGDLPSGTADAGEFRFANELVEFIRE